MNTTTRLWATPHGVKLLAGDRADLRGWLDHLRLHPLKSVTGDKKKTLTPVPKKLSLLPTAPDTWHDAMLPSWGHKNEARVGDTVYLRHKNTIRSIILTTTWAADPMNGKVSVSSPIGRALLGRHQQDRVRIDTLDGKMEYEIIKLI